MDWAFRSLVHLVRLVHFYETSVRPKAATHPFHGSTIDRMGAQRTLMSLTTYYLGFLLLAPKNPPPPPSQPADKSSTMAAYLRIPALRSGKDPEEAAYAIIPRFGLAALLAALHADPRWVGSTA